MNEINQTKEVLSLLNPWWKNGSISEELAKKHKRHEFRNILKLLDYRPIVVLSGLRRVGKTTLFYQIIEQLLKDIRQKNIVFFSFDKKVESIIKILDSYQELTNVDWRKEKVYVFLDELTKLEDWTSKLKLIYDAFPNIKLLVSSSSSVNLEEEAIRDLAGRYFMVNLKPLSFLEFLELKEKQNLAENPFLFEKEIKREFKDYLIRGFPEIIQWKDELLIKDYLRSTILDKIIKSDLPERYKNINKTLILDLLRIFYTEPGTYIDYDNLSKNFKVSKETLIKHIYYLELSYLIRIIRNFRISTFSSLRKMQRAYPYWWTLAYCYSENNDKIMENVIASYFDVKNYWRKDRKEIDFIISMNKKIIPIEIKNKEKVGKEDIMTMTYFMRKYKIKKGYLVYNGEEGEIKIKGNVIKKIPFWMLLLKPGLLIQ